MNDSYITCSLQTIHLMDATLEEDESYYFLTEYFNHKQLHYIYKFPHFSYEEISVLVNNFSYFCAKVKDLKTSINHSSNIPIAVFRYLLLEDLSWAPYYTHKKKSGWVVEGAYWSNGLFYQVRQDVKDAFDVFEVTLAIEPVTQKLYSFPLQDSRFIDGPVVSE